MVPRSKMQVLGERLVRALTVSKGVRLGESTVVSCQVHVVSIDKPEEVRIIGADAGQMFYGRQKKGTIYHIDVFHQVGCINHRSLAQVIIKTLVSELEASAERLLDHMDIQTATGGGRLTGSLAFGRKASLRRAHANHVHLAAELGIKELPLLVPVVAAIEGEILRQGLEIRKVERVCLDLQKQNGPKTDLSAYTSESDSFLCENKTSPSTRPKSGDSNSNRGDAVMKEAYQLVTETMPPSELLHLLQLLPFEPTGEHRERWGDLDYTLAILKNKGYIVQKRGRFELTDKGQYLLELINLYLPELESGLRQFLRRFSTSADHVYSHAMIKPGRDFKRLREKQEVAPFNLSLGGQLNLTATAARAACRWVQGNSLPGCISGDDLRYSQPVRHHAFNIILLVDSSASMAGDRLRAARMLAQHLVLATQDKIAVITFQDDTVLVPPGFTNSLGKIQAQLLALKATGLTPMAHALAEAGTFLQRHRVYRPLVVLITDGIPTVPLKSSDASTDTLDQAEKFRSRALDFVCIGLNPNQVFLEELCRKSGGRLYVVNELEPTVLAQLIHKELRRCR
ncbi:MAG: VWA domain-containing protein [Firmicutes bacterium]|nr:VWA domain-containing protein [Bacillota bacterium]